MKKNSLKSWEKYGNSPELGVLSSQLMDFITKNKTEREVVRSCADALKKIGANPIQDCASAKAGDIVYMNWKNRAFAAARIGTDPVSLGVNAVISHGDSPRIDVKERPLYENSGMAMFDCHYYGGIKKYQWTNVPLALHGEIHDRDGRSIPLVIGENPNEPRFTVPDLEIHVDSGMDKRTAKNAVEGENLDIIAGSAPAPDCEDETPVLTALKQLIKEKWGLDDTVLASADLALVPAGAAHEFGFDRSMIGAYGLDDRVCTAASWSAFLDMTPVPERTAVHMVMDKEEIGSDGVAGADGAFFETFMLELLRLQKSPCDALTLRKAIAATAAISADVTSGRNPLYESSYVRDQQPLCGNGVVLVKFSGSGGKYEASEARGELMATVISLLDAEDVPWQVGSFGKIDAAGGGTLAKYIARLGADIIDIGPALLSMHSPIELVSKADFAALQRCYRAFFSKMKPLAD
ncbi:MAG: aminopeptidase 1 [Pyramidobacter sp.]|nr:aminopeptidase 1 [Pyramidobacter sp.]